MPDLYLIKQAEQGKRPARGSSATGGRQSCRPAAGLEIGNQNGSYRDAFAAVDDLLAAEPAGA
jgi:hypothetical protein